MNKAIDPSEDEIQSLPLSRLKEGTPGITAAVGEALAQAAAVCLEDQEHSKGPNRNFQVYDPLDFLAAVTAHIPDRGEHLVRYYGWYSSVRRGRRRKLGLEEPAACVPAIEDDSPSGKEARRCWSRLIRKIYEVDPLLCPECGSAMKIIAFIEEEDIVRKILEHLRLREEPGPRAPPPVPAQIDIEYQPFLEG